MTALFCASHTMSWSLIDSTLRYSEALSAPHTKYLHGQAGRYSTRPPYCCWACLMPSGSARAAATLAKTPTPPV